MYVSSTDWMHSALEWNLVCGPSIQIHPRTNYR